MKRVKKSFRMELRDGNKLVVAQEYDGKLRMTESSPSAYDAVDLTAAMCEAAGILDALEDVPEPWQRLSDALTAEGIAHALNGAEKGAATREAYARAAAALGIKPEGES